MRFAAPFDAILSHKSAARVPGVSQQLATMLMLFDRLVTGQVVPMNPAAAVPRLNHVVNTGKALVLEAAKSTPAVILRDLRDRALLATLIYFFGQITALKMKVVAGFTALLPVNAPFSADQRRVA
jgi:hypothetical protein